MEIQKGDVDIIPFSFENKMKEFEQVDCWLTYTNEKSKFAADYANYMDYDTVYHRAP